MAGWGVLNSPQADDKESIPPQTSAGRPRRVSDLPTLLAAGRRCSQKLSKEHLKSSVSDADS